ncbi:hypothetical protein OF83DRAFT_350332 [Amylostereum chailletii]|nr:hypothetical protein OF83DRAFT_350332 [Amylostereum chailletii]
MWRLCVVSFNGKEEKCRPIYGVVVEVELLVFSGGGRSRRYVWKGLGEVSLFGARRINDIIRSTARVCQKQNDPWQRSYERGGISSSILYCGVSERRGRKRMPGMSMSVKEHGVGVRSSKVIALPTDVLILSSLGCYSKVYDSTYNMAPAFNVQRRRLARLR